MFSKIISVAVALLLASPSDDAAAATKKKKKKTPIENSQSYTRGTSSMMRSKGRVTQGRLPTPRGTARASPPATASAVGGGAAASATGPALNLDPKGNQSYTLLPAPKIGGGGNVGENISPGPNQPPTHFPKPPPRAGAD